jgi:GTP-binding protein
MLKLNYQNANFMLSVAELKQLPPDQGVEVAFVGRSNAGKSSVLNQLVQNKQLARTSKTPGRTQLINLFSLDAHRRLVDLPGYGYAKVSREVRQQWHTLLDAYLRGRTSLRGLVLVSDIRHPLKEFDQQILTWACQGRLPVHVLLNKADKLSASAAKKTFHDVCHEMVRFSDNVTVQIFSALKNLGVPELRDKLKEWYKF